MTLTKYSGQYEELFSSAVLWFTGYNQTNLGFPILPAGVTVTPNGTWSNDLNLGNNKSVKTFDGSTNYIGLSNDAAWNLGTGNFTISFWCYPVSGGTDPSILVSRVTAGAVGIYCVINYVNNYWRLVVWSGSSIYGSYDAASIVYDQWAHCVLVRNGATVTAYINLTPLNVGTASANIGSSAVNFPSGNLSIGNDTGYPTRFLKGRLKDLMIFKGRALTQPEIITLMRLTEPGKRDIAPILLGIRGVE